MLNHVSQFRHVRKGGDSCCRFHWSTEKVSNKGAHFCFSRPTQESLTMSNIDCCEFVRIKKSGGDGASFSLSTNSRIILGRQVMCILFTVPCVLDDRVCIPCCVSTFSLVLTWAKFPLTCYRDKECDFRIQLPDICDRHALIETKEDGKVSMWHRCKTTKVHNELLVFKLVLLIHDALFLCFAGR